MMRENMRRSSLSVLGVTQPIIELALHARNLTLPFTREPYCQHALAEQASAAERSVIIIEIMGRMKESGSNMPDPPPTAATSGPRHCHARNFPWPSGRLATVAAVLMCHAGSFSSARAVAIGEGRRPTIGASIDRAVGRRIAEVDASGKEGQQEQSSSAVAASAPRVCQTRSCSARSSLVVAQNSRGGAFKRQERAAVVAAAATAAAAASDDGDPATASTTAETERETHGAFLEGDLAAESTPDTKQAVDQEDGDAGEVEHGVSGAVRVASAGFKMDIDVDVIVDNDSDEARVEAEDSGGDSGGDTEGSESQNDTEEQEEEELDEDEGVDGIGGEEEEEEEGLEDDNLSPDGGDGEGGKTSKGEHRPTAPFFSFPPGPRLDRTEAEESLQDVIPVQQRLVKYLTDDKVFGAQVLCSAYFLMGAVAFLTDTEKFSRCYPSALMALTIKQWGTVVGRVRRVLVPHLLYEPRRYDKYRAKVAALALDPAVQGIVYCGIFMLIPLGNALLPLLLKESVYLIWVLKEVLQIMAPGLVETLTSILDTPLSVVMTAGDVGKWRETPEPEKRILLGRRLAQMCFKLEMAIPFSAILRVLPGVVHATLNEAGGAEGTSFRGRVLEQIVRMLPAAKFLVLMMVYVKLLTVRNGQFEDDVRVLRGLKIRGRNCEWIEQVLDSVLFGKIVGCPWWVGLLVAASAVLPNHDATKKVMASDNKLKTLGMTLLNLAIGRTPGAEDDEREGDDDSEVAGVGGEGGGDKTSPPPSKMAKIAKVAAVAAGITDV